MGRTIKKNVTEKERRFFEDFESNANISDDFQDFIQYGFFHLTSSQNLQKNQKGIEGQGIEKKGLMADIGNHSFEYEKERRVYYAIGAIGVLGVINRGIFLSLDKLVCEKNIPIETAKGMVFENVRNMLLKSVWLKLNIEDGKEYDSQDFMSIRNSHTIPNKHISPDKLELLSCDGSTNALKLFEFFYNNCDPNQMILGSPISTNAEYVEENYIGEFIDYVHSKSKNTLKDKIETSLKVLDLAERKKWEKKTLKDKRELTQQDFDHIAQSTPIELIEEARKQTKYDMKETFKEEETDRTDK